MDYMCKISYASIVGSLMYAMVCPRHDIAHAVGVVRKYMKNLGKKHSMTMKWILRYLRGTTNQALCFRDSNIALQGYVEAYMAGDRDKRRRTIGYVFTVGGTTVSWVSKIQNIIVVSTTETEYVIATEASKEMIWLQRFMDELGKKQKLRKIVTAIVAFILQRIQPFILRLNIYSVGIISYCQFWMMDN